VLTFATDLFVVAGIGVVLVGLAVPAFGLPMQAWFGDRVPYAERGRVFGITELTWSMGLLSVVPISGFLIERTSWRAPFILVSVFSAIGALAVVRGIDSDRPKERTAHRLVLTSVRVRVLAVALLFSVAAEIPFIVYGQWLEGSFGLSVAGIGAFTIVVVAAELTGGVLVTVYGDRWGLRRTVLGGLLVSGVAYLGFSVTGSELLLGMVVVVAWIAAFEVTVVAAIPFASELAVESRERLLSMFTVMIAVGRAIGALAAQPLFAAGGIGRAGLVSAGCVALAALLLTQVGEHAPATPATTSTHP
jgi:predicted MFS family arabinose efflux permease